ncbi:hypothetical protein [Flavobacterium flavigenum]|uniref:hypothetical protein n=1 Tax=Flavobacterium flavigenum TaxID=3003258 RepID=UPI0022ABFB46|nr:hypothetical protein [Flavobacterium flavigenum]
MEKLIKDMFKDVIESNHYDETVIKKYFSENYLQLVDNKSLDFSQFNKHMAKINEITSSITVDLVSYASGAESIFTKHIVSSNFSDGTHTRHKVFAEFKIIDQKITYCDELTFLIEGPQAASDMGSIM